MLSLLQHTPAVPGGTGEAAETGFAASLPLATLDLVGLGLVGFLVVLGIWRGLWWQVIRLAGILAAVLLARALTPDFEQWMQQHWPELSPRLRYGAAWALVFFVALGGATLLGILGQKMLEAMQLGFANRLGGGFLGAATGVLLHLALVLGLVQLAPEHFVQDTVAGTYSQGLFDLVERHVGGMIDDPTVRAQVRGLLDEPAAGSPLHAEELPGATPPLVERGSPPPEPPQEVQ